MRRKHHVRVLKRRYRSHACERDGGEHQAREYERDPSSWNACEECEHRCDADVRLAEGRHDERGCEPRPPFTKRQHRECQRRDGDGRDFAE